ncbi:hypothetical protein AB0M36_06010 [Actinoplanes sp. NPDC051346]|uniref:hypothetical protein n=1 Tax=Actinoplanes sp. NPDC051346 TaxID=3155048 RepID=UPI0034338231
MKYVSRRLRMAAAIAAIAAGFSSVAAGGAQAAPAFQVDTIQAEPEDPDAPPAIPGGGDVGGDEEPVAGSQPGKGGPDRAPDNCTAVVKKSVANVKNSFDRVQRWSDENNTPNKDTMEVHVTKTKKFAFHIDISVEEELKAWVFAKVKATINGGISKEWTTESGAKRIITLQPRTLTTVEYGVWNEVVAFRKYQVYRSCQEKTLKTGKATMPYEERFKVSQKPL